MRTIIDIPDMQVETLNQLSKKKKLSRAEIIRQALTDYITNYAKSKKGYKSAFGIWKDQKLDGLLYQHKLRGEWDE
ncbi:ribbon-helix-helix domain-containing protein [Rickettsia endosymbiont of Culicoides newsteadi]|uniref:ribbon-helix-helix domain-containing protein n=1 Tax=Rickettsia endosymbiont of Culicoides newsteadi TaxID=1961830 RepID=UPI000B9B5E4B|nr:CopG family transcriptional regulator [Rickettsia endosymbiont of Culicoides newsteadi]MCC8483061.1 ribbon-helix-helix domain-containing protein [Rickettsia endosymbiont of Labidopullus appendiculatus]OZG31650.1 hypothetical protein RiCNE_09620 [Rickettsia endosymbiont of Culicoides newsteadi]